MKLFGSSGVRRIADASLFTLTLKVAGAVGKRYNRVIVGCDTRTSSDMFKHVAISGLAAAGASVFDAGVVPTPTLALAARRFDAALMVTASHNPPEYNGIKLFNPDGSAFGREQQSEIEALVSNSLPGMVAWDRLESSQVYHGAIEQHINHIRRHFPHRYRLKVALDCACGAASVITPYLLQEMGCELISLNCNPSGFFPHPVEPLEENLQDLKNMVKESGADVGIAHDGDADRMMGVDERGAYISGDKMLCLLAQTVAARDVVTTVDASKNIEDYSYSIRRTAVGDAFVSDELKKGGDFGGEPSGAWIFPDNTLCPDGIFAAACLVDIASHGRLSQMVDSIAAYPNLRGSVRCEDIDMDRLAEALVSGFAATDENRLDGVKLTFDNGWLLARPSGTEPKVRLTVEGDDADWVHQTYDRAMKMIRGGE